MAVRRGVAVGLATAGAAIVAYFVQDKWHVGALVLTIGIVLLVAAAGLAVIRTLRETGLAITWVGSASLALVVVVAPFLAAEIVGGSLDDWNVIYVAGAFGGLVSELIARKGSIEVPGPAKLLATMPPNGAGTNGDGNGETDPSMLPHVDLGVCGRLLLGGLAAVVALMLVAAAGDEDTATALNEAADADVSVAWAIADTPPTGSPTRLNRGPSVGSR